MKLPLISYWDECELPFLVLVYLLQQSCGRSAASRTLESWSLESLCAFPRELILPGAWPAPRPQDCAAFPSASPTVSTAGAIKCGDLQPLCTGGMNRCVSGYLGAWVLSAIKMWVPWLKGLMRQPKWEHFQKSDFCNYSGIHQKLIILFLWYRVNLLYNENIAKYTTGRSV